MITVKNLEWRKGRAETPFGPYHVIEETNDDEPFWFVMFNSKAAARCGTHDAEESAIFAAQADYEARIRSALEPSAARKELMKQIREGTAHGFLNDGSQPEGNPDLDCPYCCGSGHKGDVHPSAARELALEEAAQVAEMFPECDLLNVNGNEVSPAVNDAFKRGAFAQGKAIAAAIRTLSSPEHADDLAVDRFAIAMKQKLAKKREEGRGGWENKDECSAEYLSYLLIQHIWKGDPVDIANLAMMLQQRGERVVIDSETSSIIPDHADAGKVEGDGWKPIGSAPRDRTSVIIAVPAKEKKGGFIVGEAYFDPENYEGGDWWWAGSSHTDHFDSPISELNYNAPTHWRPLPSAPSEGAE